MCTNYCYCYYHYFYYYYYYYYYYYLERQAKERMRYNGGVVHRWHSFVLSRSRPVPCTNTIRYKRSMIATTATNNVTKCQIHIRTHDQNNTYSHKVVHIRTHYENNRTFVQSALSYNPCVSLKRTRFVHPQEKYDGFTFLPSFLPSFLPFLLFAQRVRFSHSLEPIQ